MKRNKVLFLFAVIGAGVLLWRGFGPRIFSREETATPFAQNPAQIPTQILEQSSSVPNKESESTSSPRASSPAAPPLFRDNPERLRITQNRPLPHNENTGAAPTSAESLRASHLWAGQEWKIWKGVSAIPKVSFQGTEGKELGTLGSFVVVENAKVVSDERHFSSEVPLAVFNSARNRAGIITGDIAVTLQDASDFGSFILDHDLKVKDAFPHLRLYYLASGKEPVDLVALMESLQSDPRVEKVNLEIVTQSYAKK